MPCWPWFVHWLLARWTTATQFSLVSLVSCKTSCSPSWRPPPVWFSQQCSHCFVRSISCEFQSESHSGCTFWPTAVFMEQRRRRTLLGAFSGHLMSILDVVSALLTQPYWWYCPPDVQCSATVPSLGNCDCTAQYNCRLPEPRLLTVGAAVLFVFLFW